MTNMIDSFPIPRDIIGRKIVAVYRDEWRGSELRIDGLGEAHFTNFYFELDDGRLFNIEYVRGIAPCPRGEPLIDVLAEATTRAPELVRDRRIVSVLVDRLGEINLLLENGHAFYAHVDFGSEIRWPPICTLLEDFGPFTDYWSGQVVDVSVYQDDGSDSSSTGPPQ